MPDSVNEQIALRLGWQPPGSAHVVAARKVARLTHSLYDNDWLSPGPGGKLCPSVPLYDTDWDATGELLAIAYSVIINNLDGHWHEVHIAFADGDKRAPAKNRSLPAAIAAAWLAAMEAKGG